MTEQKWVLAFAEEMGISDKKVSGRFIDLVGFEHEKATARYISDTFENIKKVESITLCTPYNYYTFENENGQEIQIRTRF